jgi:hypothetical protein
VVGNVLKEETEKRREGYKVFNVLWIILPVNGTTAVLISAAGPLGGRWMSHFVDWTILDFLKHWYHNT